MSPSWIWSDKITNKCVARVGYNHSISNKGEWNNCFSKLSNRVLPPIFISTILQGGKFLNLAQYFPYDVKLRLLAHSLSFLANQKARNAIVRAENLLNENSGKQLQIVANYWHNYSLNVLHSVQLLLLIKLPLLLRLKILFFLICSDSTGNPVRKLEPWQ